MGHISPNPQVVWQGPSKTKPKPVYRGCPFEMIHYTKPSPPPGPLPYLILALIVTVLTILAAAYIWAKAPAVKQQPQIERAE